METELSICIVLYKPQDDVLFRTLDSLKEAIEEFPMAAKSRLYIVDNSPEPAIDKNSHPIFSAVLSEITHGQGNVGFGRGHNMVLSEKIGMYHLVLNPDVELSPSALREAICFMEKHPDCGLLSPAATYPGGRRQYLCKRYPSLFDLFLRGFMPAPIRNMFRRRLDHYEMRDKTQQAVYWNPPIVSGCFMLFRGDIFRRLNGFDPRYLLYFEDFDISLRAAEIAHIVYVPDVEIVHSGGNAAKKGWWHIMQFLRSAGIFFYTHRIKWI